MAPTPSHNDKRPANATSSGLGSFARNLLVGVGLASAGPLSLPRAIGEEQEPSATALKDEKGDNLAQLLRLDKPVRPIDMVDISGGRFSLQDLRGKNATLVVFLNFQCPVSNRYVTVLNELADTYAKKDVSMIGVVCDVESKQELAKHIGEFRVGFKMMYDPLHAVSRHFLADMTPQAFLMDKNLVLRYFGAIDDQYQDRTTRLKEAKTPHVAEALEQILTGKDVTTKHTQAVGCALVPEKPEPKQAGKVTFHRDIEPILQEHCQRCHHPKDVAPFSLLSYEDARNWADDIKDYTAKRLMPPWPVTGGVPLKDDISLSQKDINLIAQWVEEGCPKGDLADAPKPITFIPRDEWDDRRAPDLVLKMPSTFHLAANGEDHYRTVVFPLNNKEELYIAKTQFIPGNKKIVHHSLTFFDGTGIMLDAQQRLGKSKPSGKGDEDYGPGYESGMGLGFVPNPARVTRNKDNPGGGLGGWVPGTGALENPEGARNVIPPDSSIFLQLHYHRSGKPETDSDSRIAIWFDKKKPEKFVQGFVADTNFRVIPKGVAQFKTTGTKVIPADCELWVISPHMHYLGKEFRVWHQPKDSRERKLLLELKEWDFNWQSRYRLKDPYPMKAGDKILVEAVFDNSAGNPNNPFSPPRAVYLGESTTDEMAFAIIGVTRKTPPEAGTDFLKYFEKLLEVQALKKVLGVKY